MFFLIPIIEHTASNCLCCHGYINITFIKIPLIFIRLFIKCSLLNTIAMYLMLFMLFSIYPELSL